MPGCCLSSVRCILLSVSHYPDSISQQHEHGGRQESGHHSVPVWITAVANGEIYHPLLSSSWLLRGCVSSPTQPLGSEFVAPAEGTKESKSAEQGGGT